MARSEEDVRTSDRTVDVTDERMEQGRTTTDSTRDDRRVEDRGARRVEDRAPAVAEGNGSAIAALVTGLLSATLAFLVAPALAAVVFGIIAIALGIKGTGIANRTAGLHKGLAVTGIVSGALGLLLGLAVIIGGVTLFQRGEVDVPPAVEDAIEQTDVNVGG